MARGQGPVMFNLRLRPTEPGVKTTKAELRKVAAYVKENDAAPPGWEVAFIEWKNPKKASSGWRRGSEEDLAFLGRVLRKAGPVELRAAEVDVPKRAVRVRNIEQLRERVDRWHHDRAKAMRAMDRAKRKETKAKYRKEADRARKFYEKAQRKLQAAVFEEEGPTEFEMAVEYEPRGRK